MASVVLKQEVDSIMARLPESATLDDLLLALQTEASWPAEQQALLEQERDPDSELRRALNRALAQSDADQSIDHDAILKRYIQ